MSASHEIIDRTIALSASLGSLIRQEIEMLRDRRPAEIAPLLEAKSQLSEQYHLEMSTLRENPSLVEAADKDDIERLKDATFLLHGILDEYRTALNAAKTVSERLVKAIGDEIAAQRRPLKGYGANASYSATDAPGSQAIASIALNQVI